MTPLLHAPSSAARPTTAIASVRRIARGYGGAGRSRRAVRSVAVKYLVFVPDGCADVALDELGGRTPLEAARMPRLAQLAARAEVGRADVIPPGLPPGSDVGNMAILGFDPAQLPHRTRADRGCRDGCRARARRGRVPLQPRDGLRRRPAGDGRLRGRPHLERAEPSDRRRARRRARQRARRRALPSRCRVPAPVRRAEPTGPTPSARRRTTSPACPRCSRPDRPRRSVQRADGRVARGRPRRGARGRRVGDADLAVGPGREARAPAVRRRRTA